MIAHVCGGSLKDAVQGAPEAASGDVEVSRAVVVEVEVGVELFAGEEVVVVSVVPVE